MTTLDALLEWKVEARLMHPRGCSSALSRCLGCSRWYQAAKQATGSVPSVCVCMELSTPKQKWF